MKVNGKEYPLWGQFVERKKEWIGGTLQETDGGFGVGKDSEGSTTITDITLTPNGETSAVFSIDGEDFGCGFDVEHGGIDGDPDRLEDGWLNFSGYGGHRFRIKKNPDHQDG